jgi:signal transduction histidine kinase/ActR/RegA family two-component response regulator
MPTVRDGMRTIAALRAAGVDGVLCADMADLCRKIEDGAGAALLAEEAVARDHDGRLADVLRREPPWSDFPLVLLAREPNAERPRAVRESMNVSLVERPVRIRSLVSVVQAALRARRHQYRVRDHLRQEARHSERVRENEERLEFALSAGRLGWWDLDAATLDLQCSVLCKQHYGQPIDRPLTYDTWLASIHPDDRPRVDAAAMAVVQDRSDYDVEYRVVWPDGTIHWILVRGRASYDTDGVPLRISGVSLDMTDRRRDEEALRAADRKKDDFLALLAHELRNPLAPITNALQTMRRTNDGVLRERCEAIMQRQTGHMVRLIDDLLDVSRINRNKMELRRAPITVADVVSNAVETARPLIEASGHQLEIALPDEPLLVDGDLTRLAQVFSNLLTNSAKYTERGGRIRLEARRDAGDVVVSVRDTGIGIPRESLANIFDMFSQVDRTLERSTGGLGIGLALVRGIVEMHGGQVTAASEGAGRGTEFRVRVPLIEIASEATSEANGGRRRPQSDRPWRVLVVDDNRDSAESMAELLRAYGNEVAVAHDGLEAVARAEALHPEIVLMDVAMPHMNGLEATRRIRAQPWGRGMIIVALTGWGQEADRARTAQAGCDGHLVKPVSLDTLTDLFAKLRNRAA